MAGETDQKEMKMPLIELTPPVAAQCRRAHWWRLGSIQLTLRLASLFDLCRDTPRISGHRPYGPVALAA
jgi:hypothetical protein